VISTLQALSHHNCKKWEKWSFILFSVLNLFENIKYLKIPKIEFPYCTQCAHKNLYSLLCLSRRAKSCYSTMRIKSIVNRWKTFLTHKYRHSRLSTLHCDCPTTFGNSDSFVVLYSNNNNDSVSWFPQKKNLNMVVFSMDLKPNTLSCSSLLM
jgi:hypothetical protein